jgi:hypothetical protein
MIAIILFTTLWIYAFYIIQKDNIEKNRKNTSYLFEFCFATIIALWIISSKKNK